MEMSYEMGMREDATGPHTDPVCGMRVSAEKAAGSAERDGVVYYFCSKGCLARFSNAPSISPPVQLSRKQIAEPKLETDPVCGMTVDTANCAGSFTFERTEYFFCAQRCLERFSKHPKHFLEPRNQTAGRVDAEYFCPMDPEVVQMGPGTCPKCGMALEPAVASPESEADPEYIDMRRRLSIAAGFTLPLFVLSMTEMFQAGHDIFGHSLTLKIAAISQWIQLVLATPVVLWCGFPFFERAALSIRYKSPNMFTLIGIGTGTAYLYSVVGLFIPNLFPGSMKIGGNVPVYFETSAVIIALVLLGQVLELRSRARTSDAIKELLGFAPKVAHVIGIDGKERDVALSDVMVGATLRVKANESVPVDGLVIEGASSVDESMISGEPIPLEKTSGSKVIGGTMNGKGTFTMRAAKVGSETVLAQIVKLVSEAQRSKAPIQRLVDTASKYFVPLVVAASVISFATWYLLGDFSFAIVSAVSVLIIACPCALGLATPMSVMVGTGKGARSGILIRNAEALEKFADVDTVVIDKTGTLTEGRPALSSIVAAFNESEESVLSFAASVERGSGHPLASAIVAAAEERGLTFHKVSEFSSEAGVGIRGRISTSLIEVRKPSEANPKIDAMRRTGETVVEVTKEGAVMGYLGISDPLKRNAADTVRKLKECGIVVVMLTGDSSMTARVVAEQLGIEEFIAEVLPSEKAERVQALQKEGRKVAMAGDGVNDAPALAAADVSIAMGTGTEVAIQSADITLLGGDLRGILRARKLSAATMTNIRQNLFFAFVYNVVGVPVAAGALYPIFGVLLSPMLAAAAMTFSSVSVITNALRLRKVDLDR